MQAAFLQANRTPVSNLRAPVLTPAGNADTITNSLGPFRNSGMRDLIYKAASTGFFTYDEPSCGTGGTVGGGSQGYATAFAGSALRSIPVVGNFLSSALGIFGQKHAQAVAREQSTLCGEVPALNDFFRVVDQAVLDGGDTGDAIQSLENAYATFTQRLAPIFKNCNAACVYGKAARAAIEKRKQDYALGSAQTARVSQSVSGGVTTAIPVFGAPAPAPSLGRNAFKQPLALDNSGAPFNPRGGSIQYGAPAPATPAPDVAQASVLSLTAKQAQTIGLAVVGLLMTGVIFSLILRRQS